MAAHQGSGLALKSVLWLLRGVQLCCGIIILALYSYFLATLARNGVAASQDVKAVEGIAGAGALYAVLGLLFLCCLAGLPLTSFVAMILDLAFACAYIFVAVANKHGVGKCESYSDTPYGTTDPSQGHSLSGVPSYQNACKMQTACMSVAIVAVFFYIFSLATELALGRNRYKVRRSVPGSFGPSAPPANPYASPADQYHGPVSGAGGDGQYYAPNDTTMTAKPGFFSRLFKGRHAAMKTNPADVLPSHTQPGMEQTATYATYETDHAAYETNHSPYETPNHTSQTPDITDAMTTHQQSSWSPVYHGDSTTSPTHAQPPSYGYGYASDIHSNSNSNSNPYAGDTYHQNQPTALPYPPSPTSAYRQPQQMSSPYEPVRRNEHTPPPRDYQYTDGLYDRR